MENSSERPNVILLMADDLGWGDTGYNGHESIKTPNLDLLASSGIKFNRFYSASPVCSPTRGSCLTGRNPYRYGIPTANAGHMKPEEITLAEVLKQIGYQTGHFGKWHLGTLTTKINDGRRGGRQNEHYSPPWENGFDECFSTEQAVPTYDPAKNQRFETKFWTGPDQFATDNLEGDAARVVMDRAIPFIQRSIQSNKPFFIVIWFHAPHEIVIAGQRHRKLYSHLDENKQHYYGCITAMDEQVGRLRAELKKLGVDEDTMIWFCSDNGPAGRGGGVVQEPGLRQQGSAGPFRGRKGSLYEGGVRVPGLMVWPRIYPESNTIEAACSTNDYFPTILDLLGIEEKALEDRPYDGVSMKPFLDGTSKQRSTPLGFQFRNQQSFMEHQYKIVRMNQDEPFELYDLIDDPSEKRNIAQAHPQIVERMQIAFKEWAASCKNSDAGHDY